MLRFSSPLTASVLCLALLVSSGPAAHAGEPTPGVVGAAKSAERSGRIVTFDVVLEHLGGSASTTLGLTDDLDVVFGEGNYSLLGPPTLFDDPGTIVLNAGFDGSSDIQIIASGSLAVGETAGIRFSVEITSVSNQGFGPGIYYNQATVQSDSGSDLSDSGTDPDANGNGDPGDSGEDDPTLVDLTASPRIGVAKAATLAGTEVTLDFYLENFGNRFLLDIELADDLDQVFGAGNYVVLSPPALVDDPGTIVVNAGFDGSADKALISSGSLAIADTARIRVVVDVTDVTDQGLGLGVYSNQVQANARGPAGTLTSDLSDAGTEPDANGDGDPEDPGENDPTIFVIGEQPVLGVAKDVTVVASTVTVDLYLENLGNTALQELSLVDDLDAVFGAGNYSLTGAPTLVDDPGTVVLNPGFNGSSDPQLLVPASSTLALGDTAQVRFTVRVVRRTDLGLGAGNYVNQALAGARSAAGAVTSDLSDDGTDPDPDGDGDPGEPGENDPTGFTIAEIPVLGVAKEVEVFAFTGAFIDVGGVNQLGTGPRVRMTLYLENLGNVPLSDLSLVDALDPVFGAGNYGTFASATNPTVLYDDGGLNVDTNYNGSTDTNLLAPGSTLGAGEIAALQVELLVTNVTDQGFGLGVYRNQATGSGQGPSGGMTSDLSDAGDDADSDDDGDPGGAGEDDPTEFSVGALVGAAKNATVNANVVTFDLYLESFAQQTATALSLTDDLDSVFGEGNYAITSPPTLVDDPGSLVLNPSYDGSGDGELLAPGSALAAGDTAQISFDVTVLQLVNAGLDPNGGLGLYSNQAVLQGSINGQTVFDASESGTDPDPDGNGDPTEPDENDATSFTVSSDAVVGVAKDVAVAGEQVTVDLYLKNFGSATSTDLSLVDDLDQVFGAGNYLVTGAPSLIVDPGTLVLNGAYDGSAGSGDPEILAAGSSLAGGATAQIQFVVDVTEVTDQGIGFGLYANQATVVGVDPNGMQVRDLSDFGSDPDADGDGDPSDPGLADPPVPGNDDPTPIVLSDAALGAALHSYVSGSQITFDYVVENLGEVAVSSISVTQNLFTEFGFGNYSVVQQPAVLEGPSGFAPVAAFDGTFAQTLLVGQSLPAGARARVRFVINVDTVTMGGSYSTQFTVNGTDPLGNPLTDLSDSGTVSDPDGDGNPNEVGENDETLSILGEESALGVAKDVSVDDNEATIDLYLENLGNVVLSDLSLVEDLDAVFGAGNYTLSGAPSFIDDPGTINLEGGFDGSGTTAVIAAGSTLAIGDTAQIRLVVQVTTLTDRGLGLGTYTNQVLAGGVGPSGTVAQDFSDDGTDPDPNGNGNPSDAGEGDASIFTISAPQIAVAKRASVTGRTVTLDYFLANLGVGELVDISLVEDLDAVFGPVNYVLLSGPEMVSTPRNLVLNEGFDGSTDTDLLDPASTQAAAGSAEQIRIVVQVTNVTDQGLGLGVYANQVTASANGAVGGSTSDLSDNGTNPDPNGNGDPGDAGEDDPTPIALRGSIGDRVWNDLDGDGVQDGGEPGLSGVTVYLDLNGNSVLDAGEPSATSNVSGAYDITNVAAGSYTVRVASASVPAGFVLTSGNLPFAETLFAGEDFDLADFGYQQQDASIGDRVWNDLDGDGVQDGGEPGLSGFTVYLDLNGNGTFDAGEPADVSDGSGAYDLTDLPTGTYTVRVDASTVLAGFVLTGGSDPLVVNLAAGEDYDLADFGYQQQDASIGDFVWNDLDGDGVQDPGEPGLAGITVYLDLNGNGTPDGIEQCSPGCSPCQCFSDTTDSNGAYDITGLATGSYPVRVDASTVAAGFVLTGGSDPLVVSLAAGEDFDDADFGYQQQADLSITKVDDVDPVAAGTSYTYTLTVSNAGPGAAEDVEITDVLAPELTLVATSGCAEDPGGVPTCSLGTIAAGADATVMIEVALDPGATGTVLNTATVTSSTFDPDTANNEASEETTIMPEADLSVTKSDSADPIAPGDTLVYTIEVSNDGPSDAMNVVATDTLPAGVTLVATVGCAEDPNGVPTCTLGTIPAGGSASYTVEVTVDADTPSGTLVNTVTVSADTADMSPGDNTASEETEVDAEAPTVTDVETIGGELAECGEVKTGVTALEVTFSEEVRDPAGDVDPDDVTNPANWLLVASGPDNDFATELCGPVMGDDVAIVIDAIDYAAASSVATLELNGGEPLEDSLHRLLACGDTSIRDIAGNRLDGDGDGQGGDDFVRTFRVARENRLRNGEFDCDLEPWTRTSTVPEEIVYSTDDIDDSSVSGSADVTNLSSSTDFVLSQCVPLAPRLTCSLDANVRIDTDPGTLLATTTTCRHYASSDCSGAALSSSSIASLLGDTGGLWAEVGVETMSPAGSSSTSCSVRLRTAAALPFTANVDRARLLCSGDMLFADGFESGDTSSWSATVP